MVELKDTVSNELTIQEIHRVELGILKEIDVFCRDNGLRYSLGGGTLLGAIRHKGFIPWDDDVDIMMPRPDYEKFINTFENESSHYKIWNFYKSKQCKYLYSKVFDDRTDLVEYGKRYGLYIDVFPIDGIPAKTPYWHVLKLTLSKHIYGYVGSRFQELTTFKKKMTKILLHIITPPISWHKRHLDKMYRKFDFEKSKNAGVLMGVYGVFEFMRSSVFKNYIRVDFENETFSCIKNYDAYLTQHYGNYMELPPIEQRISNHNFKVFWKTEA